MSEHTPAPWPIARAQFGSDHYTIGSRPPFVAVVKRIADARLIAAAPDLLAALQDAVEYLQHHLPDDALAPHRAAIAKATGAQS
jgi:hypothetical protein